MHRSFLAIFPKYIILLTLVSLLGLYCHQAQAMSDFKLARRTLIQIYAQMDEQLGSTSTVYCGCPIEYPSSYQWKLNRQDCDYKMRKQPKRANRIETELIMSAGEFGSQMDCWKEGGRKQCSKNAKFKRMEGDLHNLYPSIGELNADRLNYPFLFWNASTGMYGKCDMVVDFKKKRAQPPEEARGKIARAYLYMASKYGVKLSSVQRNLYQTWDKQYAPDELECLRNELIKQAQGNDNPFITFRCGFTPE